MPNYRLDHVDTLNYTHLGYPIELPTDPIARAYFKDLVNYWKSHGDKVIISRIEDTGVCITI